MASVDQSLTSSPVIIGRPAPESCSPHLARHYQSIVLLFASVIFLTGVISPPYLMDDVDAVQAQIARTMIATGDYITPHLDGVAYMEKGPLKYWLIALSFRIFGVHDWAARLVIALSAIGLCWVTARFAAWAMGDLQGLYAGLVLATSIGLFIFTRVMIPDPPLAFFIALTLWCFMRATGPEEGRHAHWWARGAWVSMALAMLTKGVIGVLFPAATVFLYLTFSHKLFSRFIWQRLLPLQGLLLFLVVAAPWHIAAMIANPPLVDFTMHSESGSYHGFFWFYFINEHVLRFLNLRYPRDYNTVPPALFWLLHLVWFFPWSVYLFRVRKLTFNRADRASRTQLLALCWIGFVLVFFSFSTTQEYYSFSCYPAFAILIGAAMALPSSRLTPGARVAASVAAAAAIVIAYILWSVWNLPAPGDIAEALAQHPGMYTLSMGHMGDLTIPAFAYLRTPLVIALIACLLGATGGFLLKGQRAILALALMMVLFFQAARVALHVFDPYLGTKGLADALQRSPAGRVIMGDEYYSFSSVFFYANIKALILNGRRNNLEYGSYAPNAPNVFIEDADLVRRWKTPDRWYLVIDGTNLDRVKKLLGAQALNQVAESGNKYLFVNH